MYTTRDKKPHPYDVVVGVVVQLSVVDTVFLFVSSCVFRFHCH